MLLLVFSVKTIFAREQELDKTIYILLFSYFDSALCFKWLYIIYINIDEGWLSVLNLCIQIVEVDVLPSWPTRLVKD